MNEIVCHRIIDVNKDGITLKSAGKEIYISFNDCLKNYHLEKGKKQSKCVATRDITTLSFTFYTQPKTTVVFKNNLFKKLTTGKSAKNKFFDLQKAINETGYSSYDLS